MKTASAIKKFLVVIPVLIGILTTILCYFSINTTKLDYKEMEEKAYKISENPKNVFDNDCSITVKDEYIEITFVNDNGRLIAKYNKSLELISIATRDYSTNPVNAIFVSSILGVVFAELILFSIINKKQN